MKNSLTNTKTKVSIEPIFLLNGNRKNAKPRHSRTNSSGMNLFGEVRGRTS